MISQGKIVKIISMTEKISRKVGRIRDVARETGLSVATISRVMNGAKNVRPETRAIVEAASEKLDYVPNPAARALSTNRSKTIAAIIPNIKHSVFARYIDAIEQALSDHNYSLVLAISDADPEEELMAARKLISMGADAFILTGLPYREKLINLLERRDLPYAFTSVWNPQAQGPTIGYDNLELARSAANHLVDHGHKRIAIIHGPESDSDRTVARKNGVSLIADKFESLKFYETELSVAGGKEAAAIILSEPTRPTAILCFSDVLALGVYFALQGSSVNIPDDISVMGFDNLDWSGEIVPPLTTIRLPAGKMGTSVANEIVKFLETGKPIQNVQLFGTIVERQSVKTID